MEYRKDDARLGRVRLGPGCEIDPEALVGYLSPRRNVSDELIIGEGARIRSGSVIYSGSTIGAGLETGHNVVIREQSEIGDDFNIWNNSVIDYGCTIGKGVKIHCNIYIAQFTVIEDGVFMAPGVTIANAIHPGCPDSGECMKGPVRKRGCRLGGAVRDNRRGNPRRKRFCRFEGPAAGRAGIRKSSTGPCRAEGPEVQDRQTGSPIPVGVAI